MPEYITMPDGRTVLAAEAHWIEGWVQFTSSLVILYRAHTPRLREATLALGRAAQEAYPQLQSGDEVRLAVADLDGLMDDFDFAMTNAYVGITGSVLFSSIDGPMVAAETLAEQIEVLHDHAWKEVDDADDGDS